MMIEARRHRMVMDSVGWKKVKATVKCGGYLVFRVQQSLTEYAANQGGSYAMRIHSN